MKVTYDANAKINLILDVTGVKQNGYHTIFSVMQSIGLKDVITVAALHANITRKYLKKVFK